MMTKQECKLVCSMILFAQRNGFSTSSNALDETFMSVCPALRQLAKRLLDSVQCGEISFADLPRYLMAR